MADGITYRGPDFKSLMHALKEADATAARAIRKGIRLEVKKAAEDVKREVLAGPGSGRVGIRRGIAAGLASRIDTGKSPRIVRIAASSKNLPEDRKKMLRLYNKKSWRHPVFGNRDAAWEVQQGNPYFRDVLDKHVEPLGKAIDRAMDEAHRLIVRDY